ncbi:Lrp/AsnC family transcriptional regulator, partial [Hydrogenophaga sp.]|uniref:Lrp/AsnC family transcriptional regulator n=1 Tax=Hydrogenophaga sp. TaxID=1904254 RepID=UPI003D0E523E
MPSFYADSSARASRVSAPRHTGATNGAPAPAWAGAPVASCPGMTRNPPQPSLDNALSKLDKALLNILVKDGRASFGDIARQLGISRAHARSRVQGLQA